MGIKQIIAVASAKGGVGKSTICANLATYFAKDFKVGILDADIYGPNQHILFNFDTRKPEIVLKKSKKFFKPFIKNNIKISSMGPILDNDKAAIWRGPMLSSALQQLIHSTDWGNLDILFVDMPPGTGDAYITISKELDIDGAVFITTKNKLSINDTAKSINTFKKLNIPIFGYIENSINELESILENNLFGDIPKLTSIKFNKKIYTMDFSNSLISSLKLENVYENIINA